jgi:exonuclease SbcC
MIPIKITLTNFMPYRDVQSLDFSGIHTASICGANGSGKSSIIDAMTWALWGETRARRDDDLIHAGQNECEVDFEFAVAGQRYRVVRKHARPKRRTASGPTMLHLYIAADSGYKPIDGDTMTQTERKLSGILHMDYDTFINSVYLRQGHADEFTTSTAAKRRAVLASILQLERYEELAKRARETANRRETEKEQLSQSIAEINAELEQLPACEAALEHARAELAECEAAIKAQEATLADLRRQKETLEGRRAQLSQLEKSIQEREHTVTRVQEQVRQQQARIREYETALDQREQIVAGFARFAEAREQNDAMNKNLGLVNRLTERKHILEQEISRKSQELVRRHAQAQGRVGELTKTAGMLPRLNEDYQKVQRQLEDIGKREAVLQQKKLSVQELLAAVQAMQSDRTRLEREMQEIAEKLRMLRAQKGARCPLCGCELGEDGIEHIESEYATQRQSKSEAVKASQSESAVKQGELKRLAEQNGLDERALTQEKGRSQAMLGRLENEIARAEEAGNLLGAEQAAVKEIEEHLTTLDFAATEREQVRQIDEAVMKLGYDRQKHEAVQRLYEEGRKYESPRQKLDEAERLISREREDLARSEVLAQELQAGMLSDAQKRQELAREVTVLPAVTADLARAEADLKSMAARQKQAQETVGGVRARLEYLHGLALKKKEREQTFNRAATEAQVYAELAEAFGKGVPALIIETALPEIENEANHLLARMTDNRMNVKFESQRETQKGDLIEALDIKIADELGTRNYELFSGGEAFRINFAIRIALSRLLARRAGAPLPTLIIDEGFGTQDAVGIEKLREAITAIQDDFEKILVITHIEELRDAFPARIDVVKTPDGSMISLG